jgi:hypothetical protein
MVAADGSCEGCAAVAGARARVDVAAGLVEAKVGILPVLRRVRSGEGTRWNGGP